MQLIVFLVGAVLVAIGGAMIGFGIPINEFGLGNTLINAGTTAVVGGCIVLALGAVIRQLRRIGHALESYPVPSPVGEVTPLRPPTRVNAAAATAPDLPAEGTHWPAGAAAHAAEPRENVVKEKAQADAPTPVAGRRTAGRNAPPRAEHATLVALSRRAEVTPLRRDNDQLRSKLRVFDRIWPVQGSPSVDGLPPDGESATQPEHPQPGHPAKTFTHAQEEQRPVRTMPGAGDPTVVLKSGVIDGMAYTLYADGSIEADLPQGLLRFASIDELRTYRLGKV
jgi:hypothetical protein